MEFQTTCRIFGQIRAFIIGWTHGKSAGCGDDFVMDLVLPSYKEIQVKNVNPVVFLLIMLKKPDQQMEDAIQEIKVPYSVSISTGIPASLRTNELSKNDNITCKSLYNGIVYYTVGQLQLY